MHTLVDDIGSFPLPNSTDKKSFDKAYVLAREAIIHRKDLEKDEFLLNNFYHVILNSFRRKCDTSLDVVNYPQHYDMHKQFTDIIHKAMDKGTYLVDQEDAIIPEVYVINKEAKRLHEKTGRKVLLRICVTGTFELYLKEIGITPYKNLLSMFAENVRLFAKNSILNSKYVKTEVIAVDEPSLGIHDITADRDTLLDILEKTFDFTGAEKHIHLHSASRIPDVLDTRNVDTVSFEYAASPQNINNISKEMLEKADKRIRVGISRTDIDSIVAELYEKGIKEPTDEQLVEKEDVIKKRFLMAKKRFGEMMTFAGPDCGLGGWPTQATAQLLLRRTADVVKSGR